MIDRIIPDRALVIDSRDGMRFGGKVQIEWVAQEGKKAKERCSTCKAWPEEHNDWQKEHCKRIAAEERVAAILKRAHARSDFGYKAIAAEIVAALLAQTAPKEPSEVAILREALRLACADTWPNQLQWPALYEERAAENIQTAPKHVHKFNCCDEQDCNNSDSCKKDHRCICGARKTAPEEGKA